MSTLYGEVLGLGQKPLKLAVVTSVEQKFGVNKVGISRLEGIAVAFKTADGESISCLVRSSLKTDGGAKQYKVCRGRGTQILLSCLGSVRISVGEDVLYFLDTRDRIQGFAVRPGWVCPQARVVTSTQVIVPAQKEPLPSPNPVAKDTWGTRKDDDDWFQ